MEVTSELEDTRYLQSSIYKIKFITLLIRRALTSATICIDLDINIDTQTFMFEVKYAQLN